VISAEVPATPGRSGETCISLQPSPTWLKRNCHPDLQPLLGRKSIEFTLTTSCFLEIIIYSSLHIGSPEGSSSEAIYVLPYWRFSYLVLCLSDTLKQMSARAFSQTPA
jgi:hypothetical protein